MVEEGEEEGDLSDPPDETMYPPRPQHLGSSRHSSPHHSSPGSVASSRRSGSERRARVLITYGKQGLGCRLVKGQVLLDGPRLPCLTTIRFRIPITRLFTEISFSQYSSKGPHPPHLIFPPPPSICKGPVEKPGIFVQSVKAGGAARAAGLRPGDQIVACNDVPFLQLDFAEVRRGLAQWSLHKAIDKYVDM